MKKDNRWAVCQRRATETHPHKKIVSLKVVQILVWDHLIQAKKGGLVEVVVLAACEPRGHRFERWSLHIARCVGKTSR